jgi:hypothetical protein
VAVLGTDGAGTAGTALAWCRAPATEYWVYVISEEFVVTGEELAAAAELRAVAGADRNIAAELEFSLCHQIWVVGLHVVTVRAMSADNAVT